MPRKWYWQRPFISTSLAGVRFLNLTSIFFMLRLKGFSMKLPMGLDTASWSRGSHPFPLNSFLWCSQKQCSKAQARFRSLPNTLLLGLQCVTFSCTMDYTGSFYLKGLKKQSPVSINLCTFLKKPKFPLLLWILTVLYSVCDREEHIWLHTRPASFKLCVLSHVGYVPFVKECYL